jgi:hypothetical protein
MSSSPPQDASIGKLMDWVNARARRNHQKATQARFFALGLKSLQIVLAGSIPILALASPSSSKPAVNGILGALIVMIEGFQHTFKFEQFWIHYRQAGYDLQHELTHFELRAGPYEAANHPKGSDKKHLKLRQAPRKERCFLSTRKPRCGGFRIFCLASEDSE